MRSENWTVEETGRLAVLHRAALEERDKKPRNRFGQRPPIDFEPVAAALGRSVSAVMSEVSRAGINRPDGKLRSCLGPSCRGGKMFWSESVGNRMCGKCRVYSAEAA